MLLENPTYATLPNHLLIACKIRLSREKLTSSLSDILWSKILFRCLPGMVGQIAKLDLFSPWCSTAKNILRDDMLQFYLTFHLATNAKLCQKQKSRGGKPASTESSKI